MYRIYDEIWKDDQLIKIPYMDVFDEETANQIALKRRDDFPNLFSSSVEEVETGTPFRNIVL